VDTGLDAQPFQSWLKDRITARRMSQRQLAHVSGVNHSTISRLLASDRVPSLGTARRLARGLREPLDETGEPTLTDESALPTSRVEYALRGDDVLTADDVRELMAAYVAIRTQRSVQSVP